MDLWWSAVGYVRARLTSADWPARLRMLTEQGIRLEQISASDDLTVCFCVRRSDFQRVEALLAQRGEKMEELYRGGLPRRLRIWAKYPAITLTLILMLLATAFLPGRILQIRVEGSGEIPTRLILEAAAECGVHFGADRRQIRSEQVKNALLQKIPELSWVGVNTEGCKAVILVRVRGAGSEAEREVYHSTIVAARDAVVTDVTVTGGTGLCTPGQSVQSGQVLISGYCDLGLCNRAESASGEVWGMTTRSVRTAVPEKQVRTAANGETVEKYSLLLGKKRINFHSDSGILYGTCGKMREVIWLTLPGGWKLPVALVVERYTLTQCSTSSRRNPETLLQDTARHHVTADMIAGEILTDSTQTARQGALWILEGEYQCREMIGRLRQGVYLEGDTNDDRENGERGAG